MEGSLYYSGSSYYLINSVASFNVIVVEFETFNNNIGGNLFKTTSLVDNLNTINELTEINNRNNNDNNRLSLMDKKKQKWNQEISKFI